MRPSAYYDRIIDVMEELVRFTLLVRPHSDMLADRYSERREAGRIVDRSSDLSSIAIVLQEGSGKG
jgi:arsenic resistance protein ArsH